MKKRLVLLSLIAMFTACGKKEETPRTEISTPVIVEKVIEEKKREDIIPVAKEEVIVEETVLIENKTSEVVDNSKEIVEVDTLDTTNREVVIEMSPTEEIATTQDIQEAERIILASEEKLGQ